MIEQEGATHDHRGQPAGLPKPSDAKRGTHGELTMSTCPAARLIEHKKQALKKAGRNPAGNSDTLEGLLANHLSRVPFVEMSLSSCTGLDFLPP